MVVVLIFWALLSTELGIVCAAVPTGQMRQQAASILLQIMALVQGFSATKILHFQEVAAGFDEIFSLREDAER